MKHMGLLAVFVFSVGLFTSNTFASTFYPIGECFSCEVSDGEKLWTVRADTKGEASQISLRTCRNETTRRKSSCKQNRCWVSAKYAACERSSSYEIPEEGTHTPPPWQPPAPDENECRFASQCARGEVCVNHECMPKTDSDNRCYSNSDCGYPNKCVSGQCVEGCSTYAGGGCPLFHTCSGGQCVKDGSSMKDCRGDYGCPVFQSCIGGQCVMD